MTAPIATQPATVADVLDRAADLIAAPGAWTRCALGRDASGEILGEDHLDRAVCYCASGAISRASGESLTLWDDAYGQLRSVLPESVIWWNDRPERTQSEVVTKLREAAALAREQGK